MRGDPFDIARDRKRKKRGVTSEEVNGRRPVHFRNNPWRTEAALSLAKFADYRLIENVCKLT
jgi:hypothetical protein